MRAIVIEGSGGPEVLTLKDVESPQITSENEVLVRIHAAGINPIDTKIRAAAERFPIRLPATLGCDGAGIIEATGDAVEAFAVGDEVFWCQVPFNGRDGSYAEYAVIDAALLAHKPAATGFAEAAASPLVLITAWEALFERSRVEAGSRVLIQAGAGGVGHVAIQLAKHAGASVITTVSSEEKAAFVRELGADAVINYRLQDVREAVMEWSDGEGVDVALDTVGGPLLTETFPCVRVYGDVVTILQPAPDTDWSQARVRNLRTSLELMLSPTMLERAEDLARQGGILKQCAELFARGSLQVHVAKRFPLEQAGAAHEFLEQRAPMGKLVLETA